MKKINNLWFIALFLIISVSAQDVRFYGEQNKNLTIIDYCYNAGANCAATIPCNITITKEGFLLSNSPMTNTGFSLNYTFHNTSTVGQYQASVVCNSAGASSFDNFFFKIVPDPTLYTMTSNNTNFGLILFAVLFAIAFFLLYFSNQFKLEGEPWGITITKISASLLLKLMSLGTVIYSIFLLKNTIPAITNLTKIFDSYMSMFIWGIIIFFIIYFVHQFVVMSTNLDIKNNNRKRLGE